MPRVSNAGGGLTPDCEGDVKSHVVEEITIPGAEFNRGVWRRPVIAVAIEVLPIRAKWVSAGQWKISGIRNRSVFRRSGKIGAEAAERRIVIFIVGTIGITL